MPFPSSETDPIEPAPSQRLPFRAGTPRSAPKSDFFCSQASFRQGNRTFLMDSVPGARKRHPHLPRCACADLRYARLPLHSGEGTHRLHLPPLQAWAWAKACL